MDKLRIIINFILTAGSCFGKNENDSQKFGGTSDEDTEKKTGYYDHGILRFR